MWNEFFFSAPQLKRDSLGAILVTDTRIGRIGLLFGRFAGLMLAGAGAFAGLILYSEFKVWTDPIYVRLALVVLCGGAVAFAFIQGSRMFFAKTTAELDFTPGARLFGIAIIMASLLFGFLLNLPAAAARGPIALVTFVLQATVVIAGLVPLLRGADRRRQDGA